MKTRIELRSPKSEIRRLQTCPVSNTTAPTPGGSASLAGRLRLPVPARLLLALALTVSLTGCFGFLKPARTTARHFVLSALPAAEPAAAQGTSVALGVGQVKIAAYLFNMSFAIRSGTNEIDYLPSTFWAERLDTGLQRVLAANLATLLPTDQIRLSAWQTSDVSAEVYVAVERFDVDTRGQGTLVAWWHILSRAEKRRSRPASAGSHARVQRPRLTHQVPSPR